MSPRRAVLLTLTSKTVLSLSKNFMKGGSASDGRPQDSSGRERRIVLFTVRKVFLRDRTVFLVGVNKHGSQMRDKQELAPLANRSAGAAKITREYIPTTN
jgi:hypothetical protein